MKRVLFIAYYFPPIGGAPAQRSLKFARYLPKENYWPIILTGPGSFHSEWTAQDASLFSELCPETPIYRLEGPVPPTRSKLRRRVERYLGLASRFSSWWTDGASGLGETILKSESVDLIYASMSPFESAEVASRLSRRFGIPWVADLRDPWVLDEIEVYPSILHRKLALRKMKSLLSSAALIVMNTPESALAFKRAFPSIPTERVVTITNGFDETDFDSSGRYSGRNEKFQIAHVGSFLTDAGLIHRQRRWLYETLGGAVPGVDIATRSHLTLFEAIEQWCSEDANVKEHLEIVFAGNAPSLRCGEAQPNLPLSLTRFTGYLPRNQSLKLLTQADLLFLPMHNVPQGLRATTIPSKMYEYMASGRPILGAVPEGDARDFLAQCGTAYMCRPDDRNAMVEILRRLYDRWKCGQEDPRTNAEFIRRFDRKKLTMALARQFDRVLSGNKETHESIVTIA